jgi:cell division septal protein FtsQ
MSCRRRPMVRHQRSPSPAEREETRAMWRTLAEIVAAIVLCLVVLVLLYVLAR